MIKLNLIGTLVAVTFYAAVRLFFVQDILEKGSGLLHWPHNYFSLNSSFLHFHQSPRADEPHLLLCSCGIGHCLDIVEIITGLYFKDWFQCHRFGSHQLCGIIFCCCWSSDWNCLLCRQAMDYNLGNYFMGYSDSVLCPVPLKWLWSQKDKIGVLRVSKQSYIIVYNI